MTPELIPSVDPSGLPGPVWLFQILLVFTFFLHVLFMNLTLGGTLLAAIAHTLSRGRRQDPRSLVAQRLTAINGYAISLTITTGVAPLLFIQLIYQQFFYAATIFLGWIWFWLLILLTVGYYAVYIFKFRKQGEERSGGGLWLWVAAVFFLLIAAIQVAVNLIHSQPETWSVLAGNPWAVLADLTFVPRLLHFALAGIGFSGLVLAWWAVRQAGRGIDVDANRQVAKLGWKWALWSVVAQIVDGFVFLMLIPHQVLVNFMRGGAATMVPLTIGIVLSIGVLMMMVRVKDPVQRLSLVTGTFMTFIGTMVVMIVTRHQIRGISLRDFADLSQFEVLPQWGNFLLFVVLLVAGLATVYYMVRRVLAEPAVGDDAA